MQKTDSAAIVQDQSLHELNDVTEPTGNLPLEANGKSVTAHGHYIANFKAPNQVSGDGEVADWEVALLQTDTASAILVVRGLWSERMASPEIVMATDVTITGIMYPHQNNDRALNTASELSRLDASLLTSVTDLQLYDGFIALTSETTRLGEVDRIRVAPEMEKGKVTGYYWQHISYVFIWWLLALLVLAAPFYKGRER